MFASPNLRGGSLYLVIKDVIFIFPIKFYFVSFLVISFSKQLIINIINYIYIIIETRCLLGT